MVWRVLVRVLVALVGVAYLLVRSRPRTLPPAGTGTSPDSSASRAQGRHLVAAHVAHNDFDRVYRQSFTATRDGGDGHETVRKLFAARAGVLRELSEVRMRLPNDLDREQKFVEEMEGMDRDMLERIEDARQRLGAPLVHPGPVDNAWYGQWYRAANDVLQ